MRPTRRERDEIRREGCTILIVNHNSPTLRGPRKKQRLVISKVLRTLKTQNWKGARPSFRRRARNTRRLEQKTTLLLTKKRRDPTTEITKYRTRASVETLAFNQPHTERVPITIKLQIKRGDIVIVVPITEIRMPMTTPKYEKLKITGPMTSHHKHTHKPDPKGG